jgi:hypothetical protein
MKVRKLALPDLARTVSQYVCPECRYFSRRSQLSSWRLNARKQQELRSKIWQRGAKTQTTITIKARPQGSLPAKAVEIGDEFDGPVYSTVVQQARNNMRKFAHCVVLTRVGNFYEVDSHDQLPLHSRLLITGSSTLNMPRNSDHFSISRWDRSRPGRIVVHHQYPW